MIAYVTVFDYSVEYCYECGHAHERYIDKIFLTKEKAELRLRKLLNKKKTEVRLELRKLLSENNV